MSVLLPRPLPEKLSCRVRFALCVHGAFHLFDLPAQLLGSVFLTDSVRLSLKFTEAPPGLRKLLADYVQGRYG